MKHFFLRVAIAGVLLAVPASVVLAATVDVSQGFTAPLGKSYTVSGTLSSLTLNSSELTATLAAGETLTITSPDNTKFSFDKSTAPSTTETCTASSYALTFSNPADGSTKTFTVTPSATTCVAAGTSSGSSGGGAGTTGVSGGGGGGGGGYFSSTPSPTPAPPPASPPPPPPLPASAPFGITSSLDQGSEGPEVVQLQAYLASNSTLYPEGRITGYFGPATERAVKRFQTKYGLPPVGRVGPLTLAKLNEVFGSGTATSALARTLSRGATGDDVRALQTFLASDSALYPEGTVSGYYGPATTRAVGRFQEKHGIAGPGDSGYGRVGPKTRAKLNELMGGGNAAPPPGGSDIQALQEQLRILQEQLKAMQQGQ